MDATHTNENLRTVPPSVSLFTREQIDQLGVDYLHELLNYVPGFQAFRQEEAGDEYYHSARTAPVQPAVLFCQFPGCPNLKQIHIQPRQACRQIGYRSPGNIGHVSTD